MNKSEYQALLSLFTNDKLLSNHNDGKSHSLKLDTRICHKAGVYVRKSFNPSTDQIFLKIEGIRSPIGEYYADPKLLILFKELEEVIFQYLDKLVEKENE